MKERSGDKKATPVLDLHNGQAKDSKTMKFGNTAYYDDILPLIFGDDRCSANRKLATPNFCI